MTGQAWIVQGNGLRLPLRDESVDAICTDPPYGLEFMGREWDKFDRRGPASFENLGDGERFRTGGGAAGGRTTSPVANKPRFSTMGHRAMLAYQAWCEQWATEALRVLKPGGWLLSFGGTRTWHRLACGIEDAGFEMRDTRADFSPNYGPLAWIYGSGFPKSLDVDRAIDMELCQQPGRHYAHTLPSEGRRRPDDHVCPDTPEGTAWAGFGTAAKPAWEPVIVARKPLAGSVAQNVLAYGTGALNIAATRIKGVPWAKKAEERDIDSAVMVHDGARGAESRADIAYRYKPEREGDPSGRWPSNVTLTHSSGCEPTGTRKIRGDYARGGNATKAFWGERGVKPDLGYVDADGMEEVTAWACQPDCPVWLLDQQSGDQRTSAQATAGKARPAGYSGGITYDGPHYGDRGGASRFFPTFPLESDGYRSGGRNLASRCDAPPVPAPDPAARFFYTAKAPRNERVTIDGEGHPTVKPLALMRWLVRLVTPPGGLILDPFAGSGTTGEAAMLEGFRCILIDKDPANLPSMRVRTHPYVRRSRVVTNGQAEPEQGSLL